MEPVNPTSENLRGLVGELDEKLAATRTASDATPPASAAGRSEWRGLVTELDDKLAAKRAVTSPRKIRAASAAGERRVPGWVGIMAVTLLGIAIGAAVVRPWQERCPYDREFCAVAELDIDALRITIPDSELIASLPNIDALDPNDELTAGDIFAMERFAHLNFQELLTEDDIDRLLRISG